MNLKPAVKYYLFDKTKALVIFYSIILSIFILAFGSITLFASSDVNVSGTEAASLIFICVCGLNSFKAPFRMLVQNAVSRNTLFTSIVIGTACMATVMTTMDTAIGYAYNRMIRYESLFYQYYGSQLWLNELIWNWAAYLLAGIIGFFIAALYYRMAKWQKLLVSIGIPALLVVVLPVVENVYTKGTIFRSIGKFLLFATGTNNGLNSYYFVVTCLILGMIIAALGYLLVRRAVVKD